MGLRETAGTGLFVWFCSRRQAIRDVVVVVVSCECGWVGVGGSCEEANQQRLARAGQ